MRFIAFLASVVLGNGMIPFACAVESNLIEMPACNLQDSNSIRYSTLGSESFYSQVAQDKFVYTLLYSILGKQDEGYYLEIGASEPIQINNSYFFEKNLHWNGVSLDISDEFGKQWHATRINPLIIGDATKSDYDAILADFPCIIDYLTLDIDGYYDVVLKRIPFDKHLFKIITIEHDAYRYGDTYRREERRFLAKLGYHLLCSNVKNYGYALEDWWIHPSAFPSDVFIELISLDLQEKEYSQIIEAVQTVNVLSKEASAST